KGTAPLALLGASAGRELRLGGNARLDLAITGSTAAPAIAGTADLTDATVVDAPSGFGVAGPSGRIRFDGRTATTDQLTGRLAQGGQVTLRGSVGVDPAAGLPANLTATIR